MRKTICFLFIILSTIVPSLAQSKTAHVNSQVLFDTLPSRKIAIAEIDKLSQRSDQELKNMEANLEKEYNAYMQRRTTQTAAMNQYDEGRLAKMQSDMQSRETEINSILTAKSKELNEKILTKVKLAVAVVADLMGLEYVIDESSTIYARGLNITNQVIKELLLIDANNN